LEDQAGRRIQSHFQWWVKEPNKGINYPTLSLRVHYSLNQNLPGQNPFTNSGSDFKLIRRLEIYSFVSSKEITTYKRGVIWGLGGSIYWPVSRINALGAQLEFTNNLVLQELNTRNDVVGSGSVQIGVAVTNDFPLGKFHISQSFGYYAFQIVNQNFNFYQRYGLTYAITDNFLVGVALRAHGHVADFLDLRVGWQWS
jgi:hypothetical protein